MPKWLSVLLHVLVIAGGAAGSIYTGSPIPLVATGAVNALMTSPLSKKTLPPHGGPTAGHSAQGTVKI